MSLPTRCRPSLQQLQKEPTAALLASSTTALSNLRRHALAYCALLPQSYFFPPRFVGAIILEHPPLRHVTYRARCRHVNITTIIIGFLEDLSHMETTKQPQLEVILAGNWRLGLHSPAVLQSSSCSLLRFRSFYIPRKIQESPLQGPPKRTRKPEPSPEMGISQSRVPSVLQSASMAKKKN